LSIPTDNLHAIILMMMNIFVQISLEWLLMVAHAILMTVEQTQI